MGPDPTPAYFWPAVKKRLTRLWPGWYFLTWPKDIFFDPKGKKLKNLMFLGEIFQIQTQTLNGWPDLTRTGSKNFDPDPSLDHSNIWGLRSVSHTSYIFLAKGVFKEDHQHDISAYSLNYSLVNNSSNVIVMGIWELLESKLVKPNSSNYRLYELWTCWTNELVERDSGGLVRLEFDEFLVWRVWFDEFGFDDFF